MVENNNSFTDVNSLFQKQNVSEIEDVERQIRSDIEKKKQDLREMVGERYRDLINAADTIQDMRKITGELLSDIQDISNVCGSFGQTSMKESPAKKTNKSTEEAFYSLATQMNLLVDTPENIWSALDMHQYLTAAQFYLLSHYIVNSSLNINAGQLKRGSHRDIFASFPILHHQWAAISHFKPSILKGSRAALKDATLPDQSAAESLCSIVLLEDYSPRQVFTEFLMARKTAFQDVFNPIFHATSVKKQTCDITHMLRLTIEQIVTLFHTDEDKAGARRPLFYETFQQVTDEKVVSKGKLFQDLFGEEIDVLTASRYLPDSVTGFVPKLKSIQVSISVSYIQKHVTEWLNGCKKEIHQGVKGLLSFISNIKGLALIRDAVFDLLTQSKQEHEENTKGEENDVSPVTWSWHDSCQICLNGPLSIWDQFFRPLFFERAKEILESQCVKCFDDVTSDLHRVLEELHENDSVSDTCWDHDYMDFVWHEFPHDFSQQSSTNAHDTMLSLKVKGATPSTKRMCDNLNNILKVILEDVQYFISEPQTGDQNENELRIMNIRKDVQKMLNQDDHNNSVFNEDSEPFEKYSDAHAIREALDGAFNVGVDTLCSRISSILEDTKNELNSTDIDDAITVNMLLDKATFIARLCGSIPELCDNIQKITDIDDKSGGVGGGKHQPMKRQLSSHTKDTLYKAMKRNASASLQRIHRLFEDHCTVAVSIWSAWVLKMVRKLVGDMLESRDEYFVFATTNWDAVDIDEEGEKGEHVTSSIRVPSQPSFYLSSLLYRLSEEFHRVGGTVFERATVQKLSVDVASVILEAHELCKGYFEDPKTFQNTLFQVMFDLKFTSSLLCGGIDHKDQQGVQSLRQRHKKFISSLERSVDPFDLDVFMPYIDRNVSKQTSRSSLIYSCITNTEKHHHQMPRTTSNEKPNVVPLISNPPRFMLLPISSHHAAKSPHSILANSFIGLDSVSRPLYQYQAHVSIDAV